MGLIAGSPIQSHGFMWLLDILDTDPYPGNSNLGGGLEGDPHPWLPHLNAFGGAWTQTGL